MTTRTHAEGNRSLWVFYWNHSFFIGLFKSDPVPILSRLFTAMKKAKLAE
jgi:hypothetical protein